jgi:hypothetical protein
MIMFDPTETFLRNVGYQMTITKESCTAIVAYVDAQNIQLLTPLSFCKEVLGVVADHVIEHCGDGNTQQGTISLHTHKGRHG